MARVRLFAGAADILGTTELEVPAATAGELRAALVAGHGVSAQRVIDRCSLLVDGVRAAGDDHPVGADSLVDVLPPFAGG
ncbi:MoaD/ThiS family protein [Citricoccus sp. SGAir0253]|uniref:MoaD/ThiS family protein n=1 Tax=Citricoccus sp. SGAir0253 TaxID=2567881 RepID=UPI0010CD6603|nr:MoaD/ThiS family protein [Citricoccus sp. SGAir0253]QCU78288.1 MoaD/ThiS family protein [Citricoccus sp. SGAir0253]